MPPRRFDGRRLRARRRAVDMHQKVLGREAGVGSHEPVARWESGKSIPPAEKLPAIARALGVDIDTLFPRNGDPDLVDLRCDAGYSQSHAAEVTEAVSRFRLGAAERGVRKLDETSLPALAALYGVTVEELKAAQRRSFGEIAAAQEPAEPSSPQLADTLSGLMQGAFPERRPTAAELAAAVNSKVSAEVLKAEQVDALLSGARAQDIFDDGARTVAFEALGLYFDVSPMVFHDGQSAQQRVLEDIRFLAAQHDVALAARGGERGVSPAFLAVLNKLLDEDESR
ncbi:MULTISPECIES: helix-turn-helix transcriptional regulator [unclassified Streptomyces]|uniref:helix-turn-helix transcriptional regulator n=1 Tax=unclassified Streptomyces TaxID=2593676 RepID=UPI000CD51F5C|nr:MULTISPECIES: helix-turn-helix transcriptional regulator [unclassified Streptomyces]AWL37140.1 XRE family transcriptional regulator [Streptomyces sp. SM18]